MLGKVGDKALSHDLIASGLGCRRLQVFHDEHRFAMLTRDLEMFDAVADVSSLVTHPGAFDTKQQILFRDAVNDVKKGRIGQQLLRALNDDLEARPLGPRFPHKNSRRKLPSVTLLPGSPARGLHRRRHCPDRHRRNQI